MYLLAVIEDKTRSNPDQFDRNAIDVIIEQIEIKYLNKVLLNVGLCVSFYDFVEIGEPYLYPGEGSAIQQLKFRLVVFRPFVGEIIVGKLISSNKDGVRVSLDFFDDIHIPSSLFQTPSQFNPVTNLWSWKYKDPNGGEEENEFSMDLGEEIRFRVRAINFTGLTTSAKGVTATTTSETQEIQTKRIDPSSASKHHNTNNNSSNNNNNNDHNNMPPPPTVRRRSSSIGLSTEDEIPIAMQIIGCMNDYGLGLTSWW